MFQKTFGSQNMSVHRPLGYTGGGWGGDLAVKGFKAFSLIFEVIQGHKLHWQSHKNLQNLQTEFGISQLEGSADKNGNSHFERIMVVVLKQAMMLR